MQHYVFRNIGPTRLTFGDKTLELHDDGSVSGDRDGVVTAIEKAAEEAPTEDGKARTLAMAERIRSRPIRTSFPST